MIKELITCGIILTLVLGLNYYFSRETEKNLNNMNELLGNIKNELIKLEDEADNKEVLNKIKELEVKWEEIYYKLAFYIEHDELEKVESNLVSVKSFTVSKEYNEAISDLDKGLFTISHINKKYLFKLENVF